MDQCGIGKHSGPIVRFLVALSSVAQESQRVRSRQFISRDAPFGIGDYPNFEDYALQA